MTPISEQQLQAVTSDVSDMGRNQSVMFAVTTPPKLGRLVRRMPDNSTQNVSTFTQSMVGALMSVSPHVSLSRVPPHLFVSASQVNDGVILYDQKEPVGWSAEDSFSFTVSSPPAFLPLHTFTILISYQANRHRDNPDPKTRLLNNEGTVCFSRLGLYLVVLGMASE